MPIPGSAVQCRGPHCGVFVIVGDPTTVPAWRITGNRRSRGFYCAPCAERLGYKAPGRDQELVERVCRVAAELAQTRIGPYVEHQLGPWLGSGLAIPIGPLDVNPRIVACGDRGPDTAWLPNPRCNRPKAHQGEHRQYRSGYLVAEWRVKP